MVHRSVFQCSFAFALWTCSTVCSQSCDGNWIVQMRDHGCWPHHAQTSVWRPACFFKDGRSDLRCTDFVHCNCMWKADQTGYILGF